MKIDPKNSFFRSLKKVAGPALKEEVEQVIEMVKKAPTIHEIPNLKKLKGYRICYRIKVGDYRIGVEIENSTVTLVTFGHRKDIYKSFP